MRRILAVLLVLVAAAGCQRHLEDLAVIQPPPEQEAPEVDHDRDNLLNVAYGAAVVSRTAELSLDASAVHAIDGSLRSVWGSPAGDPQQTLVFSLPALSRIDRLGLAAAPVAEDVAHQVRFDLSRDGKAWREALTVEPAAQVEPQLWAIDPVDAQYVRVQTIEPHETHTSLLSVYAKGSEIAPPDATDITGCWEISGQRARFERRGAYVVGVIDGPRPTLVVGGSDERVTRLLWTRGAAWGLAIVTLTPGAKELSGLTWFERVENQHVGNAWLGTRVPCSGNALQLRDVSEPWFGHPPHALWLYGLRFDGNDRLDAAASAAQLDALAAILRGHAASHFRLVSREFREATPQQNGGRAKTRLAALRAALTARGIDLAHVELTSSSSADVPVLTAVQRSMNSAIELLELP